MRDVLAGFADLVDFVDVDDAALGGFEIVVGALKQLEEDVLDVFADVAGFGERGGVADGEWDVENAGERSGLERFAAAGGADQQHIALVDFGVVAGGGGNGRRFAFGRIDGGGQPFVMIVDGNRERLLGVWLADNVLVEKFLDRSRAGDGAEQWRGAAELAFFLTDDVVGQVNAICTDVNVAGSFDHRSDVAGRLAAKAACGDATASEASGWNVSPAGWVLSAIAPVARAISIGHRLAFLVRREYARPGHA